MADRIKFLTGSLDDLLHKEIPKEKGNVYFALNDPDTNGNISGKIAFDIDNNTRIIMSDDSSTVNGHTVEADVPANAQFTDTKYSAAGGLVLAHTTFKHANSVTPGTAQGSASKTLAFGETFDLPTVTYDAEGHITNIGTTTMTMPENPNVDTKYQATTSKLVTTTVPNITDVGSTPILGDDIIADNITQWLPNEVTTADLSAGVLSISIGRPAILSYTPKSIPNIVDVGSVPTLGTSITVATGELSATGSGHAVATGIQTI